MAGIHGAGSEPPGNAVSRARICIPRDGSFYRPPFGPYEGQESLVEERWSAMPFTVTCPPPGVYTEFGGPAWVRVRSGSFPMAYNVLPYSGALYPGAFHANWRQSIEWAFQQALSATRDRGRYDTDILDSIYLRKDSRAIGSVHVRLDFDGRRTVYYDDEFYLNAFTASQPAAVLAMASLGFRFFDQRYPDMDPETVGARFLDHIGELAAIELVQNRFNRSGRWSNVSAAAANYLYIMPPEVGQPQLPAFSTIDQVWFAVNQRVLLMTFIHEICHVVERHPERLPGIRQLPENERMTALRELEFEADRCMVGVLAESYRRFARSSEADTGIALTAIINSDFYGLATLVAFGFLSSTELAPSGHPGSRERLDHLIDQYRTALDGVILNFGRASTMPSQRASRIIRDDGFLGWNFDRIFLLQTQDDITGSIERGEWPSCPFGGVYSIESFSCN